MYTHTTPKTSRHALLNHGLVVRYFNDGPPPCRQVTFSSAGRWGRKNVSSGLLYHHQRNCVRLSAVFLLPKSSYVGLSILSCPAQRGTSRRRFTYIRAEWMDTRSGKLARLTRYRCCRVWAPLPPHVLGFAPSSIPWFTAGPTCVRYMCM